MEVPEGYYDWKSKPESGTAEPGTVFQLPKSLYGLKQVPRVWSKPLDSSLRPLGFKRPEAGDSFYLRHDALIAVYMDDIETIQQLKRQLEGKYDMTDLGGIEVTRDRKMRTIRLNQERYIDQVLLRFGMENCKPMKTPLPADRT